MPKIVDHELQKEKFAGATRRLIARSGLEGVTMRAVAAEAGLSYGALFHYFKSKDELIMHAVRFATSVQTEYADELGNTYSGLSALERLLCDDVIIDDASRDSWMLWLTFMYKASLDQPFADMNSELINGWLNRIGHMLEQAQQAGEIAEDCDIEKEALAVWAFSSGVGQVGLLQPDAMPSQKQRELIGDYLQKLRHS